MTAIAPVRLFVRWSIPRKGRPAWLTDITCEPSVEVGAKAASPLAVREREALALLSSLGEACAVTRPTLAQAGKGCG